jgi:hypothetical protein
MTTEIIITGTDQMLDSRTRALPGNRVVRGFSVA